MRSRASLRRHRVILLCGMVLSCGLLLRATPATAAAAAAAAAGSATAVASPPAATALLPTGPQPAPAAAGTLAGQAPATSAATVEVTLPKAELTVGEPAELRLTVRVPAAQLAEDPRFPPWREAWGDAEVQAHDEPMRAAAPGGITVFSQRLVVAAFKTGKIDLPRLPIAVPLRSGTMTAWTPGNLALAVRSVLPASATGAPGAPGSDTLKPRPAAPLRPLPLGKPFFITLAVLAAAALGGAWLLWRRQRRHTAGDAATAGTRPALAPYPELLAALDRLEAESEAGFAPTEAPGTDAHRAATTAATPAALSQGYRPTEPPAAAPPSASGAAAAVPSGASPAQLALHTGLSQALRRYLGRTLDFPAPESTTSEIQRRLLALGWTSTQVRAAVEVLRACDMVKFARAGAAARGRERLTAVRRLAADCEAERAAAAASAAAAAEAAAPPLEAAG